MLRIIVFDGGCGGEAVAEYLEAELGVVEVVSVIDYDHESYENKNLQEICTLAERSLSPYIGKADLIVLGGYTVSLALDYLRSRFRSQKFVGPSINYHRILKAATYPVRVTIIMNENLLQSALCDELREGLPFSTLTIPDCSGWSTLASKRQLSAEAMRADLSPYFVLQPPKCIKAPRRPAKSSTILETVLWEKYQRKQVEGYEPIDTPQDPDCELIPSDVVLILNTCLWNVRADIEDVFGYKVKVLDFRQKLLRDVCLSLNLLGVDGGRSK